jgi:subtilase family serine protease
MAQPAMPNMAPAPAPPRKSNLVLILGIIGIIVVAALLIVFFAMRPK